MKTTLRARFLEVERVPTPWDGLKTPAETRPTHRSRGRAVVIGLVAASVSLLVVVAIRSQQELAPRGGAAADASWLVTTQGSCVEQFSAETLLNREWAFEGRIVAVEPPADPESMDPLATATTVTFRVDRWFWGGAGGEVSLRTYAMPPSSAGVVDESIGARLLAAGDDGFLWACGFTKPHSGPSLDEFEAAARRVQP